MNPIPMQLQEIGKTLKIWLIVGFAILLGAILLLLLDSGPGPISQQKAWAYIKEKANNASLDPSFVYAIAWAESSLNPKANSGHARGLMQLSKPAWVTVSNRPYYQAWNWKYNIDAGVAYLAHLKQRLIQKKKFSYPLLAATYHFGFGRVQSKGFNIQKLPKPTNQIYQKLFAGNVKPIATPQ